MSDWETPTFDYICPECARFYVITRKKEDGRICFFPDKPWDVCCLESLITLHAEQMDKEEEDREDWRN